MKNEVVVNGVKLTRDQVEAALEELNMVHQSTFADFRGQSFSGNYLSIMWARDSKSGGLWLSTDFTWALRLDSTSQRWYLTGEKKS